MKKKIKYLSVILAFVIMIVNTLPGTAVRVNASDLESVSENSIAELLSKTGEDGGDSTVPGQGTSTEPEIENETGKWSAEIYYYLSADLNEENLWQKVVKEPEIVSGEYSPSIYTQILAETPVKAGYVFCGWMYKEAVEDEKANYAPGEDIAIDKDMSIVTMVAQWREIDSWTAKISFDLNGGEESNGILEKGTEIMMQESDTAGCPDSINYYLTQIKETPTKENHVFKGWLCDSKINTSEAEGNYVVITRDNPQITFTAQWEELPKVTIKYVEDGVTTEKYIYEDSTQTTFELFVDVENPEKKDYYKFVGWLCSIDTDNKLYISGSKVGELSWKDYVNSSITFTAQWEELPIVNVVYDRHDESKDTTVPVRKKTETEEEFIFTLPMDDSECTDYVFIGWLSSLDGKIYPPEQSLSVSWNEIADMDTITFTAQWVLPSVNVVYERHDGKTESNTTIQKESETATTFSIKLPIDDSVHEGYEFIGWKYKINDGVYGEELHENELIFDWKDFAYGGTIIFEAQWVKLIEVMVDFVSETTTYEPLTIKKAVGIDSFLINMPEKDPEWEEYKFVGWKCSLDDETYKAEQPLTFSWNEIKDKNINNITFTAVWEKLPKVTVKYMDGEEEVNQGSIQQSYESEESFVVNIPETIPEKEYYRFVGWKSSIDEEMLYESGNVIPELPWETYAGKTITFEAQWQWDNENIFETGTYSLIAGDMYYLPEGTWTLEEDGYSYAGDISFSVSEDGDYTFKKN